MRRDLVGLPRLEVRAVARDGRHRHGRLRAIDRLDDERAVGGGEGLLLAEEEHARVHEPRARPRVRPRWRRAAPRPCPRPRTANGSISIGGAPDAVGGGGDRREHDGTHDGDAVRARLQRGLPRDAGDFVARDFAAGREAPRAIDEGAHAEALRLVVDEPLHALLAREERLGAIAVEADVGVGGAGARARRRARRRRAP